MDKQHIIQLAKERAKTQTYLSILGQMNTFGQSYEQQVAADARYRLAESAFLEANRAYNAAISGLSTAELSDLAGADITSDPPRSLESLS